MISKEEKVLYHDNGNLININGINYIKQSVKEEIRAERDEEIINKIDEQLKFIDENRNDFENINDYLRANEVVNNRIKDWIKENK